MSDTKTRCVYIPMVDDCPLFVHTSQEKAEQAVEEAMRSHFDLSSGEKSFAIVDNGLGKEYRVKCGRNTIMGYVATRVLVVD